MNVLYYFVRELAASHLRHRCTEEHAHIEIPKYDSMPYYHYIGIEAVTPLPRHVITIKIRINFGRGTGG